MSSQESPEEIVDVEDSEQDKNPAPPKEYGGPKGQEPTRYGDWEKNGRCIDF